MTKQQAIAIRNRAFYALIANISIVVEGLINDADYADEDYRDKLIAGLVGPRIDLTQANNWLRTAKNSEKTPQRREKMSETPRDFGWKRLG